MSSDLAPGVHVLLDPPERKDVFRTGVPALLGYVERLNSPPEVDPSVAEASDELPQPMAFSLWSQFVSQFAPPPEGGYTVDAVRGFFTNGGSLCYVVPLDPDASSRQDALKKGLRALETQEEIDLVCTCGACS
jgi:hypothetical protein